MSDLDLDMGRDLGDEDDALSHQGYAPQTVTICEDGWWKATSPALGIIVMREPNRAALVRAWRQAVDAWLFWREAL